MLEQHPRSVCVCAFAHEAGDPESSPQLVGAAVGFVALAEEEEEAMGAAVAWWGAGSCVEVVSCVVRADWRRRGGVGRRLVSALLHPDSSPCSSGLTAHTRAARCWVPDANPFHALLCRHMGFRASNPSAQHPIVEAPAYALAGSRSLVQESPAAAGAGAAPERKGVKKKGVGTEGKGGTSANAGALVSAGAAAAADIREFRQSDLDAVAALHRGATFSGKPVFGARGMPAVQVSAAGRWAGCNYWGDGTCS